MNGHFSCVDDMPHCGFSTPSLSISTSMQSPTLSKSADYRPGIVVKYERRDAWNGYCDDKFIIESHVAKLDIINQKLSAAEDDGYNSLEKAFEEIYEWRS